MLSMPVAALTMASTLAVLPEPSVEEAVIVALAHGTIAVGCKSCSIKR